MAENDDLAAMQRAFMAASGLDGSAPVRVVGVTNYQDELAAAAGVGLSRTGELDCEAEVVAEPSNHKDAEAMAVYVNGHHVGYLPAGSNAPARQAVPGRIYSSWRHDPKDADRSSRKRFYGVELWL